jgi:predicted DNA-binding transcriptional regulator AlpA
MPDETTESKLVGRPGVAEILGVSRQRVQVLESRPGFPKPLYPGRQPMWSRKAIERYAANRTNGAGQSERYREAHKRTARWLKLRAKGMSNGQIAEHEGVGVTAVSSALQRSRVARFDDLEWIPAPRAAA